MDGVEAFFEAYGLAAIFVVMLLKAIGLPIPIPADVIMLATAARAAQGKVVLWQAFLVILVALVAGSLVQFVLARGPGRRLLHRFGPYLGLTPARLDAAAVAVQRGGPIGVGVAVLTPGVRAASVAACGLADLPLRIFVPGVALGSGAFLCLHFFLGYLAGPFLLALAGGVPLPGLLAVALVALGLALWFVIRRRQRPAASAAEVASEAVEAWHEATCPLCLALGTTSRLRAEPAPRLSGGEVQ